MLLIEFFRFPALRQFREKWLLFIAFHPKKYKNHFNIAEKIKKYTVGVYDELMSS